MACRGRPPHMTSRAIFVPAGHSYRDGYAPLGAVQHAVPLLRSRAPSRGTGSAFAGACGLHLPVPGGEARGTVREPTITAICTSTLSAPRSPTSCSARARIAQPRKKAAKGGLTPRQQQVVTSYIEDHLSEPISLSMLARLAGFSPYHFFAVPSSNRLGQPPHKYRQRRIEQAKHLLGHTSSSVTEVGLTVGYRETARSPLLFTSSPGSRRQATAAPC